MREQVQQITLWILPILLAIVFHEVAHGFVASRLGDDTAQRAGRLTLNPLAHIDPLGTVIIPLLLLISGSGMLFGWAKPVPVTFANLRNPRRDMILVAAAGPATNFVLAALAALVFHAVKSTWSPDAMLADAVLLPVLLIAQYAVLMNVFLGVFNLLPIPPLDGGRVLAGILPPEASLRFQKIEPFGLLILLLLMTTHTLGRILAAPVQVLLGLLL